MPEIYIYSFRRPGRGLATSSFALSVNAMIYESVMWKSSQSHNVNISHEFRPTTISYIICHILCIIYHVSCSGLDI
jgi:hypothetical protein